MNKGALGTRTICQVAIVTDDIASCAKKWADILGVDVPEIRQTGAQEQSHAQYHGCPTPAHAKLAFFDLGQVRLELIEPDAGPSTWREFLDTHGPGLHHIAFRVQGMDDVLQRLDEKGVPLVQKGNYPGGRYAYLDASSTLGAVLELLENA